MKPVSLLLLTLVLAQGVPAQPVPQTLPAGSIEGSIVRSGTLDGIARAKVTLAGAQGSGTPQAVIVDSDGKFAFHNLAAGQYRLSASRDGYVSGEYGQRGPNGSGVPISLNAQQHLTDIRIGLTSTGAIGGRVVDRYGEPVGNANVQALRYTYQDRRRVLSAVQTVRTNDRGEYRLFWMAPGSYIVSAKPVEPLSMDSGGTVFIQTSAAGVTSGVSGRQDTAPDPGTFALMTITAANTVDFTGPGPGGPNGGMPFSPPPVPPPSATVAINTEAYLPVYYPGTTEIAMATPIDLRAGGNIEGVNLTVADVHPVRIRGQVSNGGRPGDGAQVSLYQRASSDGNLTVRGTTAGDMGTFEFRNVAPGSYELAATMSAANAAISPGVSLVTPAGVIRRIGGQPVMGVRVPVDVSTADVEGVSLVLENGNSVTGKITIEGGPSNDTNSALAGIRVQLQTVPVVPPLTLPPAITESDGTFSVMGVTSGIYQLSVVGLPRNTYIKTARLAGVDVLSNGLRIDGNPQGSLEIILGSNPGSVDAVALDEARMPEAAVTLALVPDSSQAKRFDVYRNASSDASGRIHWDGVIPGDYKIFAWEDIENGAWTDPDFMRNYEGRGTPVHIDERGQANVEVKVIPYKAN